MIKLMSVNSIWMLKRFVLFVSMFFVLAAIFVTPPSLVQATGGVHLAYTVTIEKDNPTFHVSVEMTNLTPGEFIFDLQNVGVEALDQYITDLQVRTPTQNLPFVRAGNLAWKVNQGEGVLFVDYEVSKLIRLYRK